MGQYKGLDFGALKNTVTSINVDRLKELFDFDRSPDKSLVSSAIGLFIEISVKQMTELEIYKMQKDTNRLHKTAHSFKSSCANIGANRLSHLCYDLEIATRNPGAVVSESLIKLLDEMQEELHAVFRDLNQIQHRHAEELMK